MNLFISNFNGCFLLKSSRVAIAVILLFIVSELLLRLSIFGPSSLLHPGDYSAKGIIFSSWVETSDNPELCFRLKTNSKGFFKGVPFATNGEGFRDKTLVVTKNPDVFRIAILGRSTSMGAGVSENERYSNQLEQLLNKKNSFVTEVMNFSVGAYKPRQIIENYQQYVTKYQPDVLIVPIKYGELEKNSKDCRTIASALPHWDDLRGYFLNAFLYKAIREQFKEALIGKISIDWLQRGHYPILKTQNVVKAKKKNKTVTYADTWEQFVNELKQQGSIVFFVAFPLPHHPLIGPLAKDNKIKNRERLLNWWKTMDNTGNERFHLIDLVKILENKTFGKNERIYPGDYHPNAKLHKLFAEELVKEIQASLL